MLELTGRLPDLLVACVGGGSNAMGLFFPFINIPGIEILGAEAAGTGIETGKHAATLCAGSVGVLHGSKSCLLQDKNGQIHEAHSISAGLDYPGVGPEHALFKDIKRVQYTAVTDQQALDAFSATTPSNFINKGIYTMNRLEKKFQSLSQNNGKAWWASSPPGTRTWKPPLKSLQPCAKTGWTSWNWACPFPIRPQTAR